jgi:hypothetical protein
MKYSLRSLMIAVLVLPPLLASVFFFLTDSRFLPLRFALLSGIAFVLAAMACGVVFALANIVTSMFHKP